jgi:hypothetical protein
MFRALHLPKLRKLGGSTRYLNLGLELTVLSSDQLATYRL